MKSILGLMLLVVSFSTSAVEHLGCFEENKLKECQDTEFTEACRIPDSEIAEIVATMMLENLSGVSSINSQAKIGYLVDCIDVILVSDKKISEREYEVVVKYDLMMSDCRDTDACAGSARWTVMQTTIGDGYTSSSKYKNNLVEL
jgi:hypothetical protein